MKSAQAQLNGFLAKFAPEVSSVAKAALVKMRKLFPGAIEMVYDNYNALAIGFGPNERPAEAICSIAVFPKWVTLFFLHGVGLPDPQNMLRGSGNRVRHVRLESAADLDKPAIRALITEAISRSANLLNTAARGRLVIRSISAKQRARRPAAAQQSRRITPRAR